MNESPLTVTPVISYTAHYFTCPNCPSKKEFHFGHLVDGQNGKWQGRFLGSAPGAIQEFGPWRCADCDIDIRCEITRLDDGGFQLQTWLCPVEEKDKRISGLVLLRSTNGEYGVDPIYLVVHDTHVSPVPEANEYKEYTYDEGTCPINWMHDVVGAIRQGRAFINDEDSDPHGIFEFVQLLTKTEVNEKLTQAGHTPLLDLNRVDGDNFVVLFPQLFPSFADNDAPQPAAPTLDPSE